MGEGRRGGGEGGFARTCRKTRPEAPEGRQPQDRARDRHQRETVRRAKKLDGLPPDIKEAAEKAGLSRNAKLRIADAPDKRVALQDEIEKKRAPKAPRRAARLQSPSRWNQRTTSRPYSTPTLPLPLGAVVRLSSGSPATRTRIEGESRADHHIETHSISCELRLREAVTSDNPKPVADMSNAELFRQLANAAAFKGEDRTRSRWSSPPPRRQRRSKSKTCARAAREGRHPRARLGPTGSSAEPAFRVEAQKYWAEMMVPLAQKQLDKARSCDRKGISRRR